MNTLVLALGNSLRGDDGVGAAVLDALIDLPPDVTPLDGGTPGLELVLTWQGYERVIIVDAADMGRPPGTWMRLDPNRLEVRDLYLRGTLHYAGLAEALQLAGALNLLPPEIIIFGIQPGEIGWLPGLTPPVEAAITEVCAAIRACLLE